MTRWASDDLAGRALEHYKNQGAKLKHISMKAMQDDGSMLCDEVLSKKSYLAKIKAMGEDIAMANYQQEPIDLKGCLYGTFKTYTSLPMDDSGNLLTTSVRAYCDTADTGSDYLCNVIYGEYNNEAYILDVYYTKEAMEVTEEEVARRYIEHGVNRAKIESNNGGRGFARTVERILKEKFKSNKTKIERFHQGQNKVARILSNSTWVMDHIYFPSNWRDRWPDYYNAMVKYQREGKNKNDDAPDATTGVAEQFNAKSKVKINSKARVGIR